MVGVLHVSISVYTRTEQGDCKLVSPVIRLHPDNSKANFHRSSSFIRCCPGEIYIHLVCTVSVGNSSHILQAKKKHIEGLHHAYSLLSTCVHLIRGSKIHLHTLQGY